MANRLGWICARCGNSLSPESIGCPACTRPPGTPGPRGPIPAEPVSAGEAGNAPQRRYLDYPVGGPGCPGCSPPPAALGLRPLHVEGMVCSPPCGDGPCGKGDTEEAPLTVCVPAYMAEPGHRHVAALGREWEDVFAGQQLQARLGSFGGVNETARAFIDFRLTPAGGPGRD